MTNQFPTPQASRTTPKTLMLLASILLIAIAGIALLGGLNQASAETSKVTETRERVERVVETDPATDATTATQTIAEPAASVVIPVAAAAPAVEASSASSFIEHTDPVEGEEAFFECTQKIWQRLEGELELDYTDSDDDWKALQAAVDAETTEECIPLLPADEQESYLANMAFGTCSGDIYDEAYSDNYTTMTDEEYAALDDRINAECLHLLPQDEQDDMLAWAAHDDCIQASTIDPGQFNSLAAREECLAALPEDMRAEQAAYLAYDRCLADNGAFDNDPWGQGGPGSVSVNGIENFNELIFGENPATITITSDGSTITVETAGDVVEFDHEAHYAAMDLAYEACTDLDPYGHHEFMGEEHKDW